LDDLKNKWLTECSTQKNPDDVVITLSLRTPLTKARKGGFKDTDLDYLVYALLKEVIAKSQIDPALVEDICLGNVSYLYCRIRDFKREMNEEG
jgi:acetyl-CoA acetyltransferase